MGWASNVFPLLIVVSGAPNTGLFVYKSGGPGKGNLIAQIVAPGVTSDPFGNTVNAVLNIGSWSALGAFLQHFGVDQNGIVYIVGPDNVTRVQINNGFGGTGPDIRFFNDFGAVILTVDPSRGGTFQYQDNNSAVQGVLIGAQVGKATTDPINGTAVGAGITVIDPVFGDSLTVVGANINLIQAAFSKNAIATANTGSGATSPFLSLAGPEQSQAGHAVLRVYGTSVDGTVPGGVIVSATDPPVRAAAALLEVQGSQVLTGIAIPAAPPAGNALLFADTSGFLRMLTGLAGDTNAYFMARTQQQVNPRSQTISSLSPGNIGGLSIPVGIGTYFVRSRLVIEWNATAGTPQFRFAGPAVSQFDVSFKSQQSGSNSTTNNANTVSAAAGNGTGYNGATLINATTAMSATGVFFDMDIWGMFTFTAAGTLTLQAETTASTLNTWIVLSGFWEVWPTL